MSDIAEIAKELGRALELGDFAAADRLVEAINLEFELAPATEADELEVYLKPLREAVAKGNHTEALVLTTALSGEALAIDVRNHDLYGQGYDLGLQIVQQAEAASPRYN